MVRVKLQWQDSHYFMAFLLYVCGIRREGKCEGRRAREGESKSKRQSVSQSVSTVTQTDKSRVR